MPGQDGRVPAGFFANAGSRQYSEPEIMLRIEQVLTPLDDAARARIVSWMISRFGAAAVPEPGDGGYLVRRAAAEPGDGGQRS